MYFFVVNARMFIEYLVKGQVETFGLISSCVQLYATQSKFMRPLKYTLTLHMYIYVCI